MKYNVTIIITLRLLYYNLHSKSYQEYITSSIRNTIKMNQNYKQIYIYIYINQVEYNNTNKFNYNSTKFNF